MQKITLLLERFKKITPPDSFIRESVSVCVKKSTNISIPVENISVKGGVVFISDRQIVKTSVFLKKEEILQELQKELLLRAPKDIR